MVPLLVGEAVPLHPLDHDETERGLALLTPLALVANRIGIFPGLEEHLDQGALIGVAVLEDEKPAADVLAVRLLPKALRGGLVRPQRSCPGQQDRNRGCHGHQCF